MADAVHEPAECADQFCELYGCRMYREGWKDAWPLAFDEGFDDGWPEGFDAGARTAAAG